MQAMEKKRQKEEKKRKKNTKEGSRKKVTFTNSQHKNKC